MAEIDKPQSFNKDHTINHDRDREPQLMGIILDWAKHLPPSPQGVIDLAAGFGVEVKELLTASIPCLGQDSSNYMIQHACTPIREGLAEDLSQYAVNQFGGALLKDSWIFLSPNQRTNMLKGLKQILVPQGSLLTISELNPEYFTRYQAKLGIFKYSTDSYAEFVIKTKNLRDHGLLKYLSTPSDTETLAEQSGFIFELIQQYDEKNPLAEESRWHGKLNLKSGFVAVLTKKG